MKKEAIFTTQHDAKALLLLIEQSSTIKIDGFPCFAPELCHAGTGFTAESFAALAQNEAASFWFQARNKLIAFILQKYCRTFSSFLEIGCGTGFALSNISKNFPHAALYGSEISTYGLPFAASRLGSDQATLFQMDARNIPFNKQFDVIGAFDVLEHIEEDDEVISQVKQALTLGGYFILTVPQHEFLWSTVDAASGHVRRYTKHNIHKTLTDAGFTIIRSTSFVSLLLPAMMLSRGMQNKKAQAACELEMPKSFNVLGSCVMTLERILIKAGLNLPGGGSRLVLARKV